MKPTFALVDCNNFYASCEKLFKPAIKDMPVVVLSNNDGCVVARSKEAKALGIKMGVPAFQIKSLIHQHKIQVISSNYALYADISSRVMQTLESMAPRVEVYSIDEAFVDLTGVGSLITVEAFGQQIRQRIAQDIGMAVCVGIAPSKTLAKLANQAAKTYPATQGVVDLSDPARQQRLMAMMPVREVWGIGARLGARLNALGIITALELARANPKQLRKQFSVVIEKTISELNAQSCLELEQVAPAKQQIMCSRSFGKPIRDFAQMHHAVCGYVARASEKLRQEQLVCKSINIFIRSSAFNTTITPYSNSATTALREGTSDTRTLMKLATSLLSGIWKDGVDYAKAGVMLGDFCEAHIGQQDLFAAPTSPPNSSALMSLVDRINQGKQGKVWFASQGREVPWIMKQEHLSPAYTTQWADIPSAR